MGCPASVALSRINRPDLSEYVVISDSGIHLFTSMTTPLLLLVNDEPYTCPTQSL